MRNAIDKVNHWLGARIPGLMLDADHVAALKRDDGTVVVIDVMPHAGLAYLSSVVGPLPEEAPEEALFAALRLNQFGRPLGGCWLAWDDELQVFVLCHNVQLDHHDELALNHVLDNFLSAVDAARQVLTPPQITVNGSPLATA